MCLGDPHVQNRRGVTGRASDAAAVRRRRAPHRLQSVSSHLCLFVELLMQTTIDNRSSSNNTSNAMQTDASKSNTDEDERCLRHNVFNMQFSLKKTSLSDAHKQIGVEAFAAARVAARRAVRTDRYAIILPNSLGSSSLRAYRRGRTDGGLACSERCGACAAAHARRLRSSSGRTLLL